MTKSSFQWVPVVLAAVLAVSIGGCVEIGSRAGGGICGLTILALSIIAIVEIAGSNSSTENKLLWILLIMFLPVIGLIIWYLVRR